MSETTTPEETPAVETTPATESTQTSPTEEGRPVLISRLIHVIGQFLAEHVEKPADEMTEEMKHLFALFSQHLMLVNSINADEELAHKVIAAVDAEIQRVTEEFGGERKPEPLVDPSKIIVPNIHA